MTSDETHHLHWETTLDRIELDVMLAERMLRDHERPAPPAWDVPDLTGPVPADLLARAVELRDRQARVQRALTTVLADLARQHDFTSRVERATRPSGPAVYLDVTA